jgi:hypothetical protein
MVDEKLSRRVVLESGAALGALALLGSSVACNKQPTHLTCTDTTGLTPSDVSVRTSLAYVDTSVEPGKVCSNCRQFISNSSANACGTRKVVTGPIDPNGYCKSYVAKLA